MIHFIVICWIPISLIGAHQNRYQAEIIKMLCEKWTILIHNDEGPITSHQVIAISATIQFHHVSRINKDSECIGIDNWAPSCISHKIDDFVGDLIGTNCKIIGFQGKADGNVKIGTLRWEWSDD